MPAASVAGAAGEAKWALAVAGRPEVPGRAPPSEDRPLRTDAREGALGKGASEARRVDDLAGAAPTVNVKEPDVAAVVEAGMRELRLGRAVEGFAVAELDAVPDDVELEVEVSLVGRDVTEAVLGRVSGCLWA